MHCTLNSTVYRLPNLKILLPRTNMKCVFGTALRIRVKSQKNIKQLILNGIDFKDAEATHICFWRCGSILT